MTKEQKIEVVNIACNERVKADVRPLGDLTLQSVIDPHDFSINVLFNGRFAIKMNFEQWEGFVKEVMLLWVGNNKSNGEKR